METAVLVQMHDVTSSLLKQIGHDAETFTFAARFLPGAKSPAGKVYYYKNVSEEVYDDVSNPKDGKSVGEAFSALIKKFPDRYPFECVDDGSVLDSTAVAIQDAPAITLETVPEVIIPDDEEGLKALALSTRSEATMLTISSADECEFASHEVLKIRAERKLAIEKVNKIKIPATQAWKAACELFNEIDGRYAEAEKFLDDGILRYRAVEKKRIADENASIQREQQEAQAKALREQQAEFDRLKKIADDEAAAKSAQLAEEDAQIAAAQGATQEEVQQIRETPVPVVTRHVAPPPLAFAHTPAPLAQQTITKVSGLSFTTEWLYEVTDASLIPVSHEFYTLDLKKVNARVQSLKQHASIPGVRVYSEERSIKRSGK